MKKIVAPIDFSAVSLNAARYAANMAAYLDMPLQLMHVTVLNMSYGQLTMPLVNEDADETPHMRLSKVANDLKKEMNGMVQIETVHRTGSPVYEIKSHCNRLMPFAVVTGTHGDSDFTRFLLGSTTIGLIKECVCPVVVVPNGFEFKPPKKIGLANDFHNIVASTPSEKIHEIVTKFGGHLEILHVESKLEALEDVVEAKKELSNIFTIEKPKIRILKSVQTEETLLSYAAQNSIDLLIVVPKKHNWFELIVKRQHTNNMALHATVPVMLLKYDL